MKKIIFVVGMILFCALSAVAQDRVITFDQLPKGSQDYITKYFGKEAVIHVKIDDESYGF